MSGLFGSHDTDVGGRLLPSLPISGTNLRVRYEWDNGKADENLRKHGVDFTDAIAALEDLNRLEELDEQFVYDEERVQVIGVGSRRGAIRDRHVARRGYLPNHIGPEGHTT